MSYEYIWWKWDNFFDTKKIKEINNPTITNQELLNVNKNFHHKILKFKIEEYKGMSHI